MQCEQTKFHRPKPRADYPSRLSHLRMLLARPALHFGAARRALGSLLLVAAAFSSASCANDRAVEKALSPFLPMQPLGPHAWVAPAAAQPANAGNEGFISNLAALQGAAGWVVLNTGPGGPPSQRWKRAVAQQTAPIVAVLNTRAAAEAGLGNSYFYEYKLISDENISRYMHIHCDVCEKNMRLAVAAKWPAATVRVPQGSLSVAPDGVSVPGCAAWGLECMRLSRGGEAPVLAVFEPRSRVLFAGGLVWNRVVPDLRATRLADMMQALRLLRQRFDAAWVIPEQGPAGGPELVDETLAYLQALSVAVRAVQARGEPEGEAVTRLQLPQYAHWARYDELNPLNVQRAWRELEAE